MNWTEEAIKAAKENLAKWESVALDIKDILTNVGKQDCLWLSNYGRWEPCNMHSSFFPDIIYRLKPDFQPFMGKEGEWKVFEVRPMVILAKSVVAWKGRYGFTIGKMDFALSQLSDFRNGGVKWRDENGEEVWSGLTAWTNFANQDKEPHIPVAVRIWVEE